MHIYEVLDYHTDETFPNQMKVVQYFKDATLSERPLDGSDQGFEKALNSHPGDQLSLTYIERCEYLHAHPPDSNWNGEWVMTSK